MYHKSEFYNKGMLSAHPETSVIRTGNPGEVASVLAAATGQPALRFQASGPTRARPTRAPASELGSAHGSAGGGGGPSWLSLCELTRRERKASAWLPPPPNSGVAQRLTTLLCALPHLLADGPAKPVSVCHWSSQVVGDHQWGSPNTRVAGRWPMS